MCSTLRIRWCIGAIWLLGGLIAAQTTQTPVDYGRQVRPILASRCFTCHGPDGAKREADLRLDLADALTAPREGGAVVVAGNPKASLLLQRLCAADDDRMPPLESGKVVSVAEIALLERWIAEGASTSMHWSFRPLVRPAVPTAGEGWARNPIDHFIAAAHQQHGLAPALEAGREQLCRRLHLDLLGLPADAATSESFAADESADALARLLEKLLQSPHHAERMAMDWLDAARYADSNGYHHDTVRGMWPWRDELIAALQRNQPMDHFVVEQLAGDLLPAATQSQKLASGFHRNVMTNSEGGSIPAEFLDQYVADRVATTGTAFLGLTLGCARCHDHKYDPISQREFFGFYAFFHQVPEEGLIGADEGNVAPLLQVPSMQQEQRRVDLDAHQAHLRFALSEPDAALDAAMALWSQAQTERLKNNWVQVRPVRAASKGGATCVVDEAGMVRLSGTNPETDEHQLDFVVPASGARAVQMLWPAINGAAGRGGNGNVVLTDLACSLLPQHDGEAECALALEAYSADFEQPGYAVSGAFDADPKSGFAPANHQRRKPVMLAWRLAQAVDAGRTVRLRLRYDSVFPQHVAAAYEVRVTGDAGEADVVAAPRVSPWFMSSHFAAPRDDVRAAKHAAAASVLAGAAPSVGADWSEHPELVDAKVHSLPQITGTVYLARQITLPRGRSFTLRAGSDDGLTVWVGGAKVHENPTERGAQLDQDMVRVTLDAGVHTVVLRIDNTGGESGFAFRLDAPGFDGIDAEGIQRLWRGDGAGSVALRDHWRENFSVRHAAMRREVDVVDKQRVALQSEIPNSMVMGVLAKPRETRLLKRGQYDMPSETVVSAGVPACLPSLPESAPRDRLALARWMVDGHNPLPPRVIANRLWQQVFGIGLVETAEDFGVQGAVPSHPELLDWLACELVDSGWDIRHVLRTIVLSATWRQGGACADDVRKADPDNRWLTRGSRYRLHAELLRDQALFASGLLVPKIGGPPVRPYQPPGLWEEMSFAQKSRANSDFYVQDSGEALWRRGLYTLVKRSVPNPELALFDAPNRETCLVRRSRTNTPLQALVLLNSPTFLEAARVLAEQELLSGSAADTTRLNRIFRKLLARSALPTESQLLLQLLQQQRKHFAEDTAAAAKLLAHGDHPRPALDSVECAAWTLVCSVLLNLDETVTRN